MKAQTVPEIAKTAGGQVQGLLEEQAAQIVKAYNDGEAQHMEADTGKPYKFTIACPVTIEDAGNGAFKVTAKTSFSVKQSREHYPQTVNDTQMELEGVKA